MKWIFGIISVGFLLTSCDNELVVTDEWKDIPVVWGLLSKSDTAHYIRVEKAFLDPTTSALDIARIPDSLYYDDAVVTLKRIASGQVYTLTRVNGDLEGYPREGGIFAETPNYLYKIKNNQLNLVVGDTYEFSLVRNDLSLPVTAETIILPKPVLRNPSVGTSISFKPKSQTNFSWNEIADAGMFDLQLRFHYKERSPETGNIFEPRVIQWTVAKGLSVEEHPMEGSEFYSALKANIEEDFEATRRFDSLDIIVWCGGREIAEFIRVTQANTGITSTQDIPSYSNLSEGIGIFSSRNVAYYTGYNLNDQTIDSLQDGSITKAVEFPISLHPHFLPICQYFKMTLSF